VLLVTGADGRPGGWLAATVAVRAGGRARLRGWTLAVDATQLLALDTDRQGWDVPIGLPDAGPRQVDGLARRRLGRRGVCVFPAPVRAVLAATDYPGALAVSRAADGRGLSVQTWGIVARVADADAALGAAGAGVHDRVGEVHPEVSFAALAGSPLPSKHTAPGAVARRAALGGWLDGLDEALAALPARARTVDALDALAAAWSAARWARGVAEVLPEPAPRDGLGRPMRLVV